MQASAPPVQLALSRAGVTGVHKAIRIRHGEHEILMAAELDCTVDLARDQKGVHTRLIVTAPTPGSAFRERSASPMISGPLGHPGEVSDMSTSTSLPISRTS